MIFIKKFYIYIFACVAAAVIIAFLIFTHSENDTFPTFSTQQPRNDLSLIIDPGHGGEDGGAVSLSGICESDINLAICLKMEQILGLYGISPVMTRNSAEINYPQDATTIKAKKTADQKSRVKLINEIENAVLISIHQNKYTTSKPFGAMVFYADTEHSSEFAEYMQALLISSLDTQKHRTASQISKDIYLMNNINCPAILIECGFLSNENDEKLLKNDDYQTKLASVIVGGYLNFYDSLK